MQFGLYVGGVCGYYGYRIGAHMYVCNSGCIKGCGNSIRSPHECVQSGLYVGGVSGYYGYMIGARMYVCNLGYIKGRGNSIGSPNVCV